MTLLDFFRNVGNFSYYGWKDVEDSYVRFRIYSIDFFDSFFDLGFKSCSVRYACVGPYSYIDIVMQYSEFENFLKFLIDK